MAFVATTFPGTDILENAANRTRWKPVFITAVPDQNENEGDAGIAK